jgi:carbonic anhydrase/acetyltransferase-like protein (isoleucine patch superfamily)
MNAVIMDNVVLGEESIVGALTFIKEGVQIPRRSLVVGNPGRIIREVSDEMIAWKTKGTSIYQALPDDMQHYWRECNPLTKSTKANPIPKLGFQPWKRGTIK